MLGTWEVGEDYRRQENVTQEILNLTQPDEIVTFCLVHETYRMLMRLLIIRCFYGNYGLTEFNLYR